MEFHDLMFNNYMNLVEQGDPVSGLRYIFASVAYKSMQEQIEKNRKIFWVTINPSSEVKVKDFVERVSKLLQRSFVADPIYTYEQRGKSLDELGKGLHVHILFDKDSKMSPKQLQTRIYSTFKDMVGNIKHIDVRVYPASFRDDKIKYLTGNKQDPSKLDAVLLNSNFRQAHGLQELYGLKL